MKFYKGQATGNDFILFDFVNNPPFELKTNFINKICDRHFGIGADGVLIISNDPKADFRMIFYNPDGSRASFCGNGGRVISLLADKLGFNKNGFFIADDGLHFYQIKDNFIRLSMTDIQNFRLIDNDFYFINSGTEHTVLFMKKIENINILPAAKKIRYDKQFQPQGTNVNFVEIIDDNKLFVRTYEKGVEAETLSCGTGVVASAVAYALKTKQTKFKINITTAGGKLVVSGRRKNNIFTDIYLEGDAEILFKGEWY